jgi:hypothetical protein
MQFDYYTTTVILSRSRSSVANDLPLNGTSAHATTAAALLLTAALRSDR